jgi:cephalosporin hydroxylase
MDEIENFRARVARNIRNIGADADFLGMSNIWIRESIRHEYAQNFTWLGAAGHSGAAGISMRSRN